MEEVEAGQISKQFTAEMIPVMLLGLSKVTQSGWLITTETWSIFPSLYWDMMEVM